MARHPKPTALKAFMNNPGGRALPNEPKYPPIDPTPPADICHAAQDEWRRLIAEIGPGVLTIADYSVARDYCLAFAKCIELEAILAAEGDIITNKNGEKQRHPAALAHQVWQRMKEAARIQLGYTPVSRARVPSGAAKETKDADPWALKYGG